MDCCVLLSELHIAFFLDGVFSCLVSYECHILIISCCFVLNQPS